MKSFASCCSGLFSLPVWLRLLLAATFIAASLEPASARGFSALCVDAHTGEVLFSQAADAQRHPASLTKVMTLYVLFEEINAGRMTMATRLKVSRHAAARPPSRLGLKAGDTIAVEDAVKALVTRSANDVAATIGENISGSEAAFAERMTRTARSIGMTRTTFRNASGLPNPAQVTTARDMATLGLRIQRDFPQYYPYFSIRSFTYKGRMVRTHNRLLGRFKGADGIKTGYIHASGFNLTTSAARGGRRMVGVVMGANSSGARNQYMMKMLDKHFAKAKASKKNVIAALAGSPPGVEPGTLVEFAATVPAKSKPVLPDPGSPTLASVQGGTGAAQAAIPGSPAKEVPGGVSASGVPNESSGDGEAGLESSDAGEAEAVDWPEPASGSKTDNTTAAVSAVPQSPTGIAAQAAIVPETLAPKVEATPASAPPGTAKTAWNIQVGAYPKAKDARRRLDEVRALKLTVLRQKTALAVPVSKGKSRLYRARFLGFSEKSAKETCRQLTRQGVSCLTLAPQG